MISPGVSLPIDFVTKTCAILAQRRKGKTYTASVLAEEFVAARLPFVALDPTGAWWGLRASADGESAGLPVNVIGGQHGDVPLERGAGEVIADLVLDRPGYYVLDLSLLEYRAAEREFATAFATRLHRRKMQPGMDFPLHLFVDEADLFVPQEREEKGDVKMLGAFQGIVRRGGLHGLGSTLISQRPALINKSALTQLDLLILLRLIAGQDQEAVYKNYVKRSGTKEQQAALMDSLASLPVGEAWIWEPGADPPLFERVEIRERRTFNSSATPKPGERRVEPRVLAEVDREALVERMAATVERVKREDPKELQRMNADLERRLAAAQRTIEQLEQAARVAERKVQRVVDKIEVPVLAEGEVERLGQVAGSMEAVASDLTSAARSIGEAVDRSAEQALDAARRIHAVERETRSERHPPAASPAPAPRSPVVQSSNGELGAAARHFLTTLAQRHPMRMTIGQMGTLAGRKPRGGSFNTAMRELRDGGFVVEERDEIWLSELGIAEAGVEVGPPPSPAEVVALWRSKLPGAAPDLFDELVRIHPYEIEVEELAARLGRKPHGGSWNTAVATLVRNRLAEKAGSTLRACDDLFVTA